MVQGSLERDKDMRNPIAIDGQAYWTPNFIGVGAPKCATTWISEVLRSHPYVFVTNPKEVRYFVGDNWRTKDLRWYLNHFENSGPYCAAGEFTTNYLVEPASAERIYSLLGPVKIIAAIRNPVDRFFSHFRQKLRNGSLPKREYDVLNLDDFHQAIEANPSLLKSGDYYQGILKYYDTFDKKNVLVLVQEDIKLDSEVEFAKLCDFLEIEPILDQESLNRKVLKGTLPKHRTIDRSARKVAKILDKHSPRLVNSLRKAGLFSYFRQKNSHTADKEMVVDGQVRDELAKYYRGSSTKLEELICRPLDWDLGQKEAR